MAALKSQRDEPSTKREYELTYIMRPSASSDQISEINSRVRRIVEEADGKVLRLDNWGKRKLAYEVSKEMKGIYLYWLFLADAGLIAEIERNLRMSDLVIRHFSVKVDEDVHPDARPTTVDEESFTAAATLVPDEEDAYMRRSHSEGEEGEGTEGTASTEEKPAESASTEEKPAESAPAEEKPDEAAPAEEKPAEAAPAEEKPAEEKPAAEAAPAEEKPAEEKPAEEKPAAAAPAEKEKEE